MTESLELRRTLRATPERVFDAWTDPQQLVAWWGPPGGRCTEAQVDLRVGGAYAIANETAALDVVWIRGKFVDVERPSRLVYTWTVAPEQPEELVTVHFVAVGEGTEVRVLHERIVDEEMVRNHTLGWNACIDGLERLLQE